MRYSLLIVVDVEEVVWEGKIGRLCAVPTSMVRKRLVTELSPPLLDRLDGDAKGVLGPASDLVS